MTLPTRPNRAHEHGVFTDIHAGIAQAAHQILWEHGFTLDHARHRRRQHAASRTSPAASAGPTATSDPTVARPPATSTAIRRSS